MLVWAPKQERAFHTLIHPDNAHPDRLAFAAPRSPISRIIAVNIRALDLSCMSST
jgi:hypothetical protein